MILFAIMLIVGCPFVGTAFASVQGLVTDPQGKPLAGAIATITEVSTRLTWSTYSDQNGRFEILHSWKNKVSLRVRYPLYQDAEVENVKESNRIKIKLQEFKSKQDFSDSLVAAAHESAIPWKTQKLKTEFVSQCNFCHQFGNALTRRPREQSEWKDVIHRMEGMGALLTWDARKNFPEHFHKYLEGKPLEVQSKELRLSAPPNTLIREWPLANGASFIHDLEVLDDGKIYAVDMSFDQVFELDRQTNGLRAWDFPESSLKIGGIFASAIEPFGTYGAKRGPHSIHKGPDGKLWMTYSLSSEIGIFDPKLGQFKIVPLSRGVYPHTMRFDRDGRAWFTLAVSNQVAVFDPKTEKVHYIDLPSNGIIPWFTARLTRPLLELAARFPKTDLHLKISPHNITGNGAGILTLPYGIDISPKDGSIWYSKVYANRIGRIDPKTFEVKEFVTPLQGPRRLRFDYKNSKLWIPSFVEGALMSFDAESSKFEIFKVPTLREGEIEIPYVVNVNPKNHDVWFTANASDRLMRFRPETGEFTAYPLPTRVTFMREIVFTPDGEVCSTYSNLPARAIEGGRPKVVCLKTDQ